MKILVVNPNATTSMTDKIALSARAVAAPDTDIIARSGTGAPASIEGHHDEAMSLASLLHEVRLADEQGIDGTVVACFDDPGIGACRELSSGPVIGICEAGMKAATILGTSFSVVTTLPRSVPHIEELSRRYGVAHHCRRVRSAQIPVLALEEPGSEARLRVRDEIRRAIDEDRCESVLLGCAGMADLTRWLSDETGIPVIDGVSVAVKFIEGLIAAGLNTSKVCAYARPNPK